jgi:V/A-type H+-transporting ATPase subunit F
MSQKAKIAVIGDQNSIMIFKVLGFSVFPVEECEDIGKQIKELERNKFSIIYITENIAAGIETIIDEYKDKSFPAIIPIPNKNGALGIGKRGIEKNIEKAVGADIF